LRKGGSASFSTPTRITPTRRSQTGAESKGEVINVDDVTEEPAEDEPEEVEYGFAPLKVCIKAVWAARCVSFDASVLGEADRGEHKVPIWLMIDPGNGPYIVWILWNSPGANQWPMIAWRANSVAL